MLDLHEAIRSAIGRTSALLHVERWGVPDEWYVFLFHNITDDRQHRHDDPRTEGLGADVSNDVFAAVVGDLVRNYNVVGLDDALAPRAACRSGKPRALVCFDDAYASVVEVAAPVLREAGLPWVFFVNPRMLDGEILAVDNLLAYVVNTYGTAPLAAAFGEPVHSLRHAVADLLPLFGPTRRNRLVSDITTALGINAAEIATRPRLYATAAEVRQLADSGVEIGNHTYDHVHGRSLDHYTAVEQIVSSQARLHQISGKPVRTFAYPYGSSADATAITTQVLADSGHTSVFLVHGRTNRSNAPHTSLHRISITASSADEASLQMRVLPRLRAGKAHLSAMRLTA